MTLVELSAFAAALGIERGELVSLVGGGGKTTSLFALGEQLHGATVLTTTTKMGAEQCGDLQVLLAPTDEDVKRVLADAGRVLVWQDADGRRAFGVEPTDCDRWFDTPADNVVVEADGSRKRPFKAPADYEPVVPSATTLLVACIGVGAFGRPIAESCHRPELVAGLAACSVDDVLTPARAGVVLRSRHGSQKGRPAHASFAVAVHRVDDDHLPVVDALADELGDEIPLIAVRELSRPQET